MQSLSSVVGTVAWQAPEVMRHDTYTEKADVYSFGIILWEIATRGILYPTLRVASVILAVLNGERPEIPEDVPAGVASLIRRCWRDDPSDRPPMDEVLTMLEGVALDLGAKVEEHDDVAWKE